MVVNAPEHVIENDVFIEAEIIEQPRRRSLKAYHRRLSRKSAGFNESRHGSNDNQSPTFSTVSAQSGRPPQRLRRARPGPVVGGPNSNVLIEILDRLAAHAEALAQRPIVCLSCNVGPGRMTGTEFSATPSPPRGPQSRSPICVGASELVAARRLPCPHRPTFGERTRTRSRICGWTPFRVMSSRPTYQIVQSSKRL